MSGDASFWAFGALEGGGGRGGWLNDRVFFGMCDVDFASFGLASEDHIGFVTSMILDFLVMIIVARSFEWVEDLFETRVSGEGQRGKYRISTREYFSS